MPNLLGTAPNQVPTNADLGKLAFMDVVDTVTNNPYLDTAVSDTKPSLLLDFANSKTLDPRITYTRASTASYYDGKTTTVAEQNLLSYSQDFDNAAWTQLRATVSANTTTAPDSTTTADSLNQTTGQTSSGVVYRTVSANAADYVFSVYAKPNGKNFIVLRESLLDGTQRDSWFNVSTGATGTVYAGHTATVTASTNGFYRCSIKFTTNAARSGGVFILCADSDGSTTVVDSGGVYLWGAQLEQRSSVSAYTPTTSSPITNYIPALQTAAAGVPRFDHDPVTGESKGFLIEEQRSNLVTYSEQFDNAAWSKWKLSVTANAAVAPDGTLSADKLVEDTNNNDRYVYKTVTTTAVAHSLSVYAKAGERNWIALTFYDGTNHTTWFDLTNGAVGQNANSSASIVSVGNGWFRCSITNTSASTSLESAIRVCLSNAATIYTGNGYSGLYIWGAQLEAGSFATSYIPTTSAQVTRSADAASITGANFSSWYRADEGTVYAEYVPIGVSLTDRYVWAISNSAAYPDNLWALRNYNGASVASVNSSSTQYASLGLGAVSANTKYKVAVAIETNNFAASANAAAPIVDTSGLVPVGDNQLLFPANGCNTIKKLAYYPKRLSDQELAEMTL